MNFANYYRNKKNSSLSKVQRESLAREKRNKTLQEPIYESDTLKIYRRSVKAKKL